MNLQRLGLLHFHRTVFWVEKLFPHHVSLEIIMMHRILEQHVPHQVFAGRLTAQLGVVVFVVWLLRQCQLIMANPVPHQISAVQTKEQ